MKIKINWCVFLFLLFSNGWVLADGRGSSQQTACEANLNMNTLPSYTAFIQTDLPDLEDYYTCKAAVKEDPQVCSIFPGGSAQRFDCQAAYDEYYATYGKLFKYGQVSDEFLNDCLKKGISKDICNQWGEVMLSGNADNCARINGISTENIGVCKEMLSANPAGAKAYFMMALRKKDPALCDQIPDSDFSSLRVMCKGLLVQNIDGCQLNNGVDRFKKLYCQYLTK